MRISLLIVFLAQSFSFAQTSFNPAGTAPQGWGVHAIADFNLDGLPDLATFGYVSQSLAVSAGTSSGALVPTSSVIPGGLPQGVLPADLKAGDLNNDGRPDVVLVGSTGISKGFIHVFFGTGTGRLVAGPRYATTRFGIGSSVLGDFDRDGNLDLIVASLEYPEPVSAGNIYLFKGNGTGEFDEPSDPAAAFPDRVVKIEAGDVNGDGRLDVVVATGGPNAWNKFSLVVGLDEGTGSFATLLTAAPPDQYEDCCIDLRLGDVNGDRAIDAISTNYHGGVRLWINNGSGLLSPQSTSLATAFGIAIGDFDLDGRNDFAYSSWSGEIGFQLGASGGGFIPSANPIVIVSDYSTLDAADFNGDRRPDLLVSQVRSDNNIPGSVKNELLLFLNTSTRTPVLLSQAINFSSIADRILADGTIVLSATASSGLPVTFATTSTACSITKNIAKLTATGTCAVIALQPGNSTYGAAAPVTRTFTITAAVQQSQTIIFAALADRPLNASPLSLSATASSGLVVSFTSTTPSACTVTGTSVTLLATGTCSITAAQPGNSNYAAAPTVTRSFNVMAAQPVAPHITSVVNAASYTNDGIAPSSYVAIFGDSFGTNPRVTLRDSAGTVSAPFLVYSSNTQINFVWPASTLGPATVTVEVSAAGSAYNVNVVKNVPGLFSANGSGQGPAAANVIIVNEDKSVTTRLVTDGPIPVLAGTEIYLVLYGTGIRGATNVTARIAGRPVDVLYAGAQGVYPGLDQINVRIPLSVGRMGTVEVQLTVDGTPSNTVTINVN